MGCCHGDQFSLLKGHFSMSGDIVKQNMIIFRNVTGKACKSHNWQKGPMHLWGPGVCLVK